MSDRLAERTTTLLAPGTATVDAAARRRVGDHLVDGLAAATSGADGSGPVDVRPTTLWRAHFHRELLGTAEPPFAWRPAYARRSLGLAAVRACVAGRFRGPADAVRPLADEAVSEWRRSGWRTYHWEPWFAQLGHGGQAVVLAEAINWATALWSSFDWSSFPPDAVVGGTEDRWECATPRPVRLRGRSDLRVPLPGTVSGGRTATPLCRGRWCRWPGACPTGVGATGWDSWRWWPDSPRPVVPSRPGSWACGPTPVSCSPSTSTRSCSSALRTG